jgi:hypothetical protein
MASFQRQLNIYDFNRITGGNVHHAYYHKYFIRGQLEQVSQIQRRSTKGRRNLPYSLAGGTLLNVKSGTSTLAVSNVNHVTNVERKNMFSTNTTSGAPSILRLQQALSLMQQHGSIHDVLLMNNIISDVVHEPHGGAVNHQSNVTPTRSLNSIDSSILTPLLMNENNTFMEQFVSSILQSDANSSVGNQSTTSQATQRLSQPNPLLSNQLPVDQQSGLISLLLSSLLSNND